MWFELLISAVANLQPTKLCYVACGNIYKLYLFTYIYVYIYFIPGERSPSVQWVGDWVGPRASLKAFEKRNLSPLQGYKPWFLGHSAESIVTD